MYDGNIEYIFFTPFFNPVLTIVIVFWKKAFTCIMSNLLILVNFILTEIAFLQVTIKKITD